MEPIKDVTGADLWQYMASKRESDYQLIDVRQPEEYQAGHIPGAKLIPLMELEALQAELNALRGKDLFFYCRSGGRSMRGASFAASVIGLPHVHNLVGGIMGWQNHLLTDFPRLKALDLGGSVAALLRQALELEKGAHRLYDALLPHFAGTEVSSVLEELARAEVGHGKVIFNALSQLVGKPTQTFEQMFAELPGDLLESGESYDEAVARARQAGSQGGLALLELALDLELNAYDLYKNLAHRAEDSEVQQALFDLAQQEKRHAEGLAKKIGAQASKV